MYVRAKMKSWQGIPKTFMNTIIKLHYDAHL
jgi:hypothetical protein